MSKLQEKYGGRGFTVMAVNGYDEPRSVVESFVQAENLKQPILLMGRSVAQSKFSVAAFPTNFWIDRDGNVVRQEVGFSADLFPSMEAYIEKLLGPSGKSR